MTTAQKFSKKTGPTYHDGKMSKSARQTLTASQQLTLLPEAHLASLQVTPGSEKARRILVGSGESLLKLLPQNSPLGLCLKTLLDSTQWRSNRCFLFWKAKTSRQGVLLFHLVASGHPTKETAPGLLPTVIARDYRSGMSKEHLERRRRESSRGVNLSEYTQRHYGGNGKLNPEWCEHLMGFPIGWTELEG